MKEKVFQKKQWFSHLHYKTTSPHSFLEQKKPLENLLSQNQLCLHISFIWKYILQLLLFNIYLLPGVPGTIPYKYIKDATLQ